MAQTTINGDVFQPRQTDNFLIPANPTQQTRYYACYGHADQKHWPCYPYIVDTTLDQIVLNPDNHQPTAPEALAYTRTLHSALKLACRLAIARGWNGWFPRPVRLDFTPSPPQISLTDYLTRSPLKTFTNPHPDTSRHDAIEHLQHAAEAYCATHYYINMQDLAFTNEDTMLILLTAITAARPNTPPHDPTTISTFLATAEQLAEIPENLLEQATAYNPKLGERTATLINALGYPDSITPLQVATITHAFGMTTLIGYTEADLTTQVAEYVSKNWKTLHAYQPHDMPSNQNAAIELYFEVMAEHPNSPETLSYTEANLP